MIDIVILGAGASGLMAAHELHARKKNFLVLEARNRVGGRVLTLDSKPMIELGPEFLHGETPLTDELMRKFKFYDYEVTSRFRTLRRGKLVEAPDFWRRLASVIAKIRVSGRDLSFADYLDRVDTHDSQSQKLAGAFVEGFDAADLDQVSAKALGEMKDQVTDPDVRESRRTLQGYGPLMEALADPFRKKIRFRHRATRVEWKHGAVVVSGFRGKRAFAIRARKVLITLPIGVLKDGEFEIAPAPLALHHTLAQFHMGQVMKRVVVLKSEFFEAFDDKSFPFVTSAELHYPTWWSSAPLFVPTVTAWAGGSHARRLCAVTREERDRLVFEDLAKLTRWPLKKVREHVLEIHEHDWSRDPHSLGAYSYPAVRENEDWKVQTSYENTLFLAGECFHREMSGTVEGALLTGRDIVKKMLGR